MENQTKSDMEIALEYIGANPDLVGQVEGDAFAYFWLYPEEVIKTYEGTIQFLKTSFGYTDEMVSESCIGLLSDACTHVQNLKANEAQNS